VTDRKTQAGIRCVPLLGVSLEAAQELHHRAVRQKSDWLMPQYASEIGNTSCAATLNKTMRHLDFRTHMFKHAFIDRLKACGDVPVPVAEAITGPKSSRLRLDFALKLRQYCNELGCCLDGSLQAFKTLSGIVRVIMGKLVANLA